MNQSIDKKRNGFSIRFYKNNAYRHINITHRIAYNSYRFSNADTLSDETKVKLLQNALLSYNSHFEFSKITSSTDTKEGMF